MNNKLHHFFVRKRVAQTSVWSYIYIRSAEWNFIDGMSPQRHTYSRTAMHRE